MSLYANRRLDLITRDYEDDFLLLRGQAASSKASEIVDYLMSLLKRQEGWFNVSAKTRRALESFLHDLLGLASKRDDSFLFRSLHKPSFKDAYVGYSPFIRVFRGLENAGLIEVKRGFYSRTKEGGEGTAARMKGTVALFELLLGYGITPSNYGHHFRFIIASADQVRDPVRLRASKKTDFWHPLRGKPLSIDLADPRVQSLVYQMQGINGFIAKHVITGCTFEGFSRQFNQGRYDKGGRVYCIGNYQNMERKDRPGIRINGEPVCEVDVSASHLTIAYFLLGIPLPDVEDLYARSGIDNRDVVKRFVTATLGAGKIPRQWPKGSKIDYLKREFGIKKKEKDYTKEELSWLQRDYPIAVVRSAVVKALPILTLWQGSGFTWADLQYRESLGLIATLEELAFRHGIPALPLHDSVIVPASKAAIVARIMVEAFREHAGLSIRVRVKS
jgi:hypothetical protein